METARLGKRGAFVIPARFRRRYGLQEGSLVIAEERPDGILLRPAMAAPIETYSPERRAAFLLENAADAEDYEQARRVVRDMGIDPDGVPHEPPGDSSRS